VSDVLTLGAKRRSPDISGRRFHKRPAYAGLFFCNIGRRGASLVYMDASFLHTFFIAVGSTALVLLVVLLGVVLFYTISILRIIYEVVILAKKQASGIALKVDDVKKYVGGSMAIRILTFFFRKGVKGKSSG
jgi:hypothetical protein